jgi:hypothetical protein
MRSVPKLDVVGSPVGIRGTVPAIPGAKSLSSSKRPPKSQYGKLVRSLPMNALVPVHSLPLGHTVDG